MGKKKISLPAKKSISVDMNVYNLLQGWKDDMESKMGGAISFNMVILSLINDRIDLDNTKSELIKIQNEAQETQNYIRQLLMKAMERPKSVIRPPSAAQMPVVPPPPLPQVSPQPPPILPNQDAPKIQESPPVKSVKPYHPPRATKNARNDLNSEVKAIFSGDVVKPSDVLKLSQPNHAKAEIKKLSDEDLLKREPEHFHAEENQDKFKKSNFDFTNIIHKGDERTEEEITALSKKEIQNLGELEDV